ncbi:TPA: hypothetical protein DDZ86_03700 [Candidatus Dependentiae bacterium]|nr:MAG: thiol-disulfide isomerase-like protein thioredoxin [candidate division TM6 bacterium GW2011_GWF2_43_87]HBL98720.1 hypothetical protein [Candidatus Dependentiae bacterium]
MKTLTIKLLYIIGIVCSASLNATAVPALSPIKTSKPSEELSTTYVKKIKTQKDLDDLIKSGKAGVIKFHAQWCPPCKANAPFFKAAAQKYGDEIYCATIDIENPELSVEVEKTVTEGVPTFVFKNKEGKTESIHVGGYDGDRFNQVMESFVKKHK